MLSIVSVLTASSSILNGNAQASDMPPYNYELYSNYINSSIDIDNVLNYIYQNQMNYIVPTLNKLKDFYKNVDTEDIIKNAFPLNYSIVNKELNYDISYDGKNYNYVSFNNNKLEDIKNNNILINSLRIVDQSNARDSNYGTIMDSNNKNGFRVLTEKDKQLISKYNSLLSDRFIINDNLINLVEKVVNNDNDNLENMLLISLKTTYNDQIKYIYDTRKKLEYFYENIDSENIIKNSYSDAYNSYTKDLNYIIVDTGGTYIFLDKDIELDHNMSIEEKIEKYVEKVRENNTIIFNFNIKNGGSSRDTDYGLIKDANSEYGYRKKTDEDNVLINNYTDLIGDNKAMDNSIIELFASISKNYKHNNTLKK